jgi:dimethylargininase
MLHEGLSYRFSRAVARQPGKSVTHGLRAVDRGQPDIEVFRAEHRDYVRLLQAAGLEVTLLPPLEAYPDSVFVEDTALCLPQGSIILRPGAASRRGEAGVMETALGALGHDIHPLGPGGTVDGGDILVTDAGILVGLSARTDRAGFEALRALLSDWGYAATAVHTPANVLHLKSDCCVLDSETVLATSRLSAAPCFGAFRVLVVPPCEEAAANSVRINDKVLVPAGFPATAELLDRAGYEVEVVSISQAALLDGGLSCMSLRLQ